MNYSKFIERIFTIGSDGDFEGLALELFQYQAFNNKVYNSYLNLIHVDPNSVRTIEEIPFLPIGFFKSQEVKCGDWDPALVFYSSGTTGQEVSKHQIRSVAIYKESFLKGFEIAYGSPKDCILLCLLPTYEDNPHSSLIYMTDELIRLTEDPISGYYLDNNDKIIDGLSASIKSGKRVILFGVSYALMDLAGRAGLPDMKDVIVMETGGMKGKRQEMVKEELHLKLKEGFKIEQVHSEYGMTEMLSQAYSKGKGIFECPSWMRVSVRDVNDPLSCLEAGRTGGLNIIDLANVHSCSFIATQDLGKVYSNGTFELFGRFDYSDIRGCNLLIAEN